MPRYANVDKLMEHAIRMDWSVLKWVNEVDISTAINPNVVERKHGKWEKKWHSYFERELPCCSVCGHFSAMRWKYCPNCGADMGEETEDASGT